MFNKNENKEKSTTKPVEDNIPADVNLDTKVDKEEAKSTSSYILSASTLLPINADVTITKFAGKYKAGEEVYSLFETTLHGIVAINIKDLNSVARVASEDLIRTLSEGL